MNVVATLFRSQLTACALLLACAHAAQPQPTPTTAPTATGPTVSTAPPAPTSTGPVADRVSMRTDPALGVIEVSVAEGANTDPAQPVHLVLTSKKAQALWSSMLELHPQATLDAEGRVRATVTRDLINTQAPLAQHRAPSFVIDYDEPSVQALAAKLTQSHSTTPTMSELERDVAAHFTNLQHGGFDIASRAATLQRGDCSEHAVLLAAVARHFGYTARVVFGFAAPLRHGPSAFGHAWTQVHDGTAWRTHDAALLGIDGVIYLPLHALVDESAGYAFAAIEKAMLMMSIERLKLAAAP